MREDAPAPRPAAVRYNDWPRVTLPGAGAFRPSLGVSVVVPCCDAPGALALTLAGLAGQRYPRGLLEVVVVDDGSEPPVEAPACPGLEVRVVRQERRGFALARARNAGARAGRHPILVFLDGDVIPEAGLVAAHARFHHAVSDALTLGFCAYVCADGVDAAAVRARTGSLGALFAGRPFDPPWLERHMARTADLTSRHDDLFRAVTGHNFGVSKAFFEEVGGFDESFARYGGEDTELAWRAQARGALLVPVRAAFGWHQGRWADGRARKARDQALQAGMLAERIAHPGFRPAAPGRSFAVPRHVVRLDAAGAPPERVRASAEALLADAGGDLVVWIELPAGREADRARLAEDPGPDPRVRIASGRAAIEEFPASPFQVSLPAGAEARPGLVDALRRGLGDAVAARASLGGGAEVSIVRSFALHRARRAGRGVERFGDVRRLPARALRARLARGAGRRRGGRAGSGRGAVAQGAARVWAEARHVRGLRTGWRLLAWLAGAARWRLRERGRTWEAPPRAPAPRSGAEAALGIEIAALGPRARAVFVASSRVAHALEGRHVDVVVADSQGEAEGARAPAVVLDDHRALAVPAFDPSVHNPVGWVREVERRGAALGPLGLLPPEARARRVVRAEDRAALAHCHHLEDVRAFHAGTAERAGTLARLAACGVPVQIADGAAALGPLLGAELHALMTADVRGADAAAREALSVAMRRAALRTHSLGARARQVCGAAGVAPAPWPLVSVLLATRRPALLGHALANVARQRYPRLELVLALHGAGFAPEALRRAVSGFGRPVKVLHCNAERALGAVLNEAADEAAGTLVAKMDDDDVYGPEHLWDLVLAHQYSGAALVGKFPATVWLARRDLTVRRRAVASETWSRAITGGAMLVARADLERAGGWRRAPRHVDRALVEDVLRTGGAVYRTHDRGYLLVRHGAGHTWEADDGQFLAGAEAVRAGWRPALAGIEDASPPPVLEEGRR